MVPITDILRQIRKGVGVQEATDQMQEVIRACMATGKAGELTIKLKFTPDKTITARNSVSSAPGEVEMSVTSKMPKLPIPKALFYFTASGEALRDDPDQSPLLGEVTDRDTRNVG